MQMDKYITPFLPYGTTDIAEPSVLPYLKEINESPETRARCLKMLHQELRNIKEIDAGVDDTHLLPFLRVSKFNTQKALQRILNFFQQCDALTDAFSKCSLPLHRAQTFNHLFVSPYRMKDNSFLILGKTKTVDYRKCTFAERFYLEVIALNHVLYENPLNQICGATCVFDFEGFDVYSLLAYTPRWLRAFVNFSLNAPLRLKAVHIVNAPPIFSSIYTIVNPLLPKKIRDRVFIHPRNGGWMNLHSFIPAEILPKKYGGKISQEKLINCLENIEEMEKEFLKSFVFGSIKNQQKRKSLKVIC